MYDASALIAGGSAQAALQVWGGAVEHAVNIAGGLHHAMRGYASGFCVFNDVVLGIRTMLAAVRRRSPTSTSTCTTATACRPRSTTTRGC